MVKIICPKCGEVKQYSSVEYVRHTLTFDEQNEVVNCTEECGIKYGKPRCVKCGRMVKITEQEGEGWKE